MRYPWAWYAWIVDSRLEVGFRCSCSGGDLLALGLILQDQNLCSQDERPLRKDYRDQATEQVLRNEVGASLHQREIGFADEGGCRLEAMIGSSVRN